MLTADGVVRLLTLRRLGTPCRVGARRDRVQHLHAPGTGRENKSAKPNTNQLAQRGVARTNCSASRSMDTLGFGPCTAGFHDSNTR